VGLGGRTPRHQEPMNSSMVLHWGVGHLVVNPILPMPDISEKPAMPNATGSMALL